VLWEVPGIDWNMEKAQALPVKKQIFYHDGE
jgi:hypothetical protein